MKLSDGRKPSPSVAFLTNALKIVDLRHTNPERLEGMTVMPATTVVTGEPNLGAQGPGERSRCDLAKTDRLIRPYHQTR